MRNTADVTGKPIAVLSQPISGVSAISFSRLLRHPWKKERGAILLFCPGHHTRHHRSLLCEICMYNKQKHINMYIHLLARIHNTSLISTCFFLLPKLIPLSGVGTTCFSSCCDKNWAIIFTTGRLPDVNPP
jgi:hypothetical protein